MFLVPRTREPPLNIKLNIPTSLPFLKNLIPNSHLYFCPIDLCLANVKVNVCIYFDKLCTSATFQEREQFCRVGGQGGFSSIVVFESNLSLLLGLKLQSLMHYLSRTTLNPVPEDVVYSLISFSISVFDRNLNLPVLTKLHSPSVRFQHEKISR